MTHTNRLLIDQQVLSLISECFIGSSPKTPAGGGKITKPPLPMVVLSINHSFPFRASDRSER